MDTPALPVLPTWQVAARRTVLLEEGRSATLRPVAVGDADFMAEFFASLTEREKHYFFWLDEERARRLALDIERDPSFRLIAVGEHDGCVRVLGYMFLESKDEGPPTFGACLHPGAQSRGLGRAMIDHLLTSAAESGLDRACLTVHPDNWRALRLYQRMGFVLTDEFVNTHQRVKQYRMEADLRSPRPAITEEVTVVPHGHLGIGVAAARVQRAIELATGWRPLILDQPAHPTSRVIHVAEFGPLAGTPIAVRPEWQRSVVTVGWIVTLSPGHLLIGGSTGPAADLAARRFAELVAETSTSQQRSDGTGSPLRLERIPFLDLHVCFPADPVSLPVAPSR
ncbi:MAG: GNAT family N-acetyltransferase [Chloroflexi bacterium]|nr:GNAT family N-acetyltransferase [Chloroflexota bacterium]